MHPLFYTSSLLIYFKFDQKSSCNVVKAQVVKSMTSLQYYRMLNSQITRYPQVRLLCNGLQKVLFKNQEPRVRYEIPHPVERKSLNTCP